MSQPRPYFWLARCLQTLLLLACLSVANFTAWQDDVSAQASFSTVAEETLREGNADSWDDGDGPAPGSALTSVAYEAPIALGDLSDRTTDVSLTSRALDVQRATGPPRA